MSNDLPEVAAAYAAKVAEEHDRKRAEIRTRIGTKSPELLTALDRMKALYGKDMRLGGVVFTDEVIGAPYPPEECARIQQALKEGR
jgi:hypothetical protein